MPSVFDLRGKIALITGSTRGIGWSTAQILAEHGATVLVNGRDPGKAGEKASELKERFGVASAPLPFDAADPTSIKDAYRRIFSEWKRLDILVNNAGVMRNAVLGMITDASIREMFEVNTISVIHHVQEASRLMSRNKSGSIINLTSVVGREGAEGQIVYAASKAALVGITRSAAKELAPRGIRVNAVAPGMIDTDLLQGLPDNTRTERLSSIGLRRFGNPAEVAHAILFLASDASSYITGETIAVDGGIRL
jgi:3-oxoacyl-[acyl-carrier protein] reductase